jgi:outer membrane protease
MKKAAGIFCLLILFFNNVYGDSHEENSGENPGNENRPFVYNLSFSSGFMYGTSYEIVYRNSSGKDYLSELQWDLKPLFFIGSNFLMEPDNRNGFLSGLGIKVGIPGKTGSMIDRDWVYTPGVLSHFSSHDNKTRGSFHFDIYTGYQFLFNNFFYIRPFASFEYNLFVMAGRNGYFNYPGGSGTFTGTVITYNQHWFLIYSGITFGMLPGRFNIKGSIKITPLVFCIGDDDHVARSTRFVDYMFGKIAVEPSIDISFVLNSRYSLGINGSYKFFYGARGDTYIDTYSNKFPVYKNSNTGGAGLELFEAAVYFRLKLGK